MCAQLDLEVMCKKSKKGEEHLIIMNFGVKKFTIRNTQKKETLMFECYNLLGPKE
jgi:hypothetical protein